MNEVLLFLSSSAAQMLKGQMSHTLNDFLLIDWAEH